MGKPPPPADKRTLVDRFFDRVKNNRIAATIIVVGSCMMALASFTDSMQKLVSNWPSLSKTEVQGDWKSGPVDLYGAGPQTVILKLTELGGGRLTGSLRFYDAAGRPATPDFDVLQGKRDKNRLSFSYDGGVRRTHDSGQTYVPVPETLSGEASSAGISFVYEREGRAAVAFSVHRVASAPGDGH
jgi:hypothetical protein